MPARLESIVSQIATMQNVEITSPFKIEGEVIHGIVSFPARDTFLNFDVIIQPQYPFQSHETETIKFINENLLDYNHVNADGSICLHTSHSPILGQKIYYDFAGVHDWIQKYFLNQESDEYYEHIIVNEGLLNDERITFLFTEVEYSFSKGEFGYFNYSSLQKGLNQEKISNTYIVQCYDNKKTIVKCNWSTYYQRLPLNIGVFVYIENAPVINRRFAITKWIDLEPYLKQDFLLFLYNFDKKLKDTKGKSLIPILVGYKIKTGETHWQCAIFNSDNFPNYGEKNPVTKKFEGKLIDDSIIWSQTKNCSYQYFFGRGILHKNITDSNILILGIGAIGSMVATTLTRGGCKNITLIDYDIKEPENVCRSEYTFITGINNKTQDLGNQLTAISPFIEIRTNEVFTDFIKVVINEKGFPEAMEKHLDQFDIIIDCTTDNDVAYILDKAQINSQVWNISITNHAKELICTVKPDLYNWLIEIFARLKNDTDDLYRPTGCWSPTFKASYNDIAILVQYAIGYINQCFLQGKPVRNFYITGPTGDDFNLKLNQF